MRLHDTYTGAVRDFVPLRPGHVSIYLCGATVQGLPHIGHVRSGVAFDVLRRWLAAKGLDVAFIRNVTDIPKALREAHRVLRYGGRFFCLEFSTVEWPGLAQIYDVYSEKLVPKLGKAIAGDEDSYRYLVESIRRFPDMQNFKRMISEAGFVQTKVEPILGGLVAIHSGWKV